METILDSKDKQMMEVLEMNVLRRIADKMLRDRESNFNVQQTCQIDVISVYF